MNNKSIAVFDSGVGGLTVLKEILKELPNENIVYFGDTARVPYGPRPKEEIIKFTMDIVDFLVTKDIKAIVIACNTITSVALEKIQEKVEIPVLGVIEPGAKMALEASSNGRIGIFATKGTIDSNVYQDKITKNNLNRQAVGVACPEFVKIAETGPKTYGLEKVHEITRKYLAEFGDFKFDTLILGCTHFPVLEDVIRAEVGNEINIVNPAFETTRELKTILKNKNILKKDSSKGFLDFYVSKDKAYFKRVGEQILEKNIDNLSEVEI